jgi:hypothetical protein
VVEASPVGLQTHSGVHVWLPTAARKMKRQSLAVGAAPLLTGWLQSPRAADATGA